MDYSSSSSDDEGSTRAGQDEESCDELDHTGLAAQNNPTTTTTSHARKRSRQDDNQEEVIMTDFEFFDPNPDDYHGVRSMLLNWLDGFHDVDISSIANAIVDQAILGTIVKTDLNPVAIATILPLSSPEMQPVRQFLLDRADPSSKAVLQSKEHIGVLVYERFLNLPWQLIPDLFESLQKDLLWARQNGGRQYEFDSIVFIARTSPERRKGKSISYYMEEQKLFHKFSSHTCSFPSVVGKSNIQPRTPQRTMIMFKRPDLAKIVALLRSTFSL